MENYLVMQAGDAVGRVNMKTRGLYYHIDCQCDISGEVMYDLVMQCGNGSVNLGILAPENGSFCLRRQIAVKKVGEGEIRFALKPRHEKMHRNFVPVIEEEPFAYIADLEQAVMARREDAAGILLPEENNAKNTEI